MEPSHIPLARTSQIAQMPYVSPYTIALSLSSDLERAVRDVRRTLGQAPGMYYRAGSRGGAPPASPLGAERPIGARQRPR